MTQKVLWDLLCPGIIGLLAYSLGMKWAEFIYLFKYCWPLPPIPHTLLGTSDLIMNKTDKLPVGANMLNKLNICLIVINVRDNNKKKRNEI